MFGLIVQYNESIDDDTVSTPFDLGIQDRKESKGTFCLTFEFVHGKKMPKQNKPRRGPPVIPNILSAI